MHEHDTADEIRDWLRTVPGDAANVDDLVDWWRDFDSTPMAVVTLYGGYDTGKSALVRRLLIETGVEVPPWLLIGGVATTFETQEVECMGIRFRDTPGIVPGATDARAISNNEEAEHALLATDAVVVMFNPQVAATELGSMRRLAGSDWPRGSLIAVIGRFDLAMDPADDPAGYLELAREKEKELRQALALPQDIPVHVVAQDAYEVAGRRTDVSASVWDQTRSWDGIRELKSALEDIPNQLETLRSGTETRFWLSHANEAKSALSAELTEVETQLQSARRDGERRDLRLTSLDSIRSAAEAQLAVIVEEIVREAAQTGVASKKRVHETVAPRLDAWFERTVADLDRLRDEVEVDAEAQEARPSFRTFIDFLTKLQESSAAGSDQTMTDHREVATKLTNVLRETVKTYIETERGMTITEIKRERATQAKRARTYRSSSASKAAKPADSATNSVNAGTGTATRSTGFPKGDTLLSVYSAVDTALPLALELFSLLTEGGEQAKQAEANATRREQLREQSRQKSEDATKLAMRELTPMLAEARSVIEETAAGTSSLIPALERAAADLTACLKASPA